MPDESRSPPLPQKCPLIRTARLSDLDALTRLEAAAFATDRLTRRSFRSLLRSASAALLVATLDDAVRGYALLLTRRGSRAARLYSIAVGAEESSRGMGSALLAAAEREARRRGAAELRLEVRADNPAAIRFYERRGYRTTGTRDSYYEDGMRAVRYARTLEHASERPAGLAKAA